ncbi:hypothetical protein [Leisingera sp. F5]|uniref:hypothetical protein n=1 Tax=Leisingera sp. F5 TaxID=1813816 RepID=UPI000A7208C7|nr:hypothetical protein [Leisingera sp. F5]
MVWPNAGTIGRAYSAAIPLARAARIAEELPPIAGNMGGAAPEFGHLAGRNWIYVVKDCGDDPIATLARYDAVRPARANPMFMAKRNGGHSSILYVGSKRTNGIAERLRQHISADEQTKTYALKMGLWFEGNYQVFLRRYHLEADFVAPELAPLVLQIIEDSIADELLPAFGKRGSNGR